MRDTDPHDLADEDTFPGTPAALAALLVETRHARLAAQDAANGVLAMRPQVAHLVAHRVYVPWAALILAAVAFVTACAAVMR